MRLATRGGALEGLVVEFIVCGLLERNAHAVVGRRLRGHANECRSTCRIRGHERHRGADALVGRRRRIGENALEVFRPHSDLAKASRGQREAADVFFPLRHATANACERREPMRDARAIIRRGVIDATRERRGLSRRHPEEGHHHGRSVAAEDANATDAPSVRRLTHTDDFGAGDLLVRETLGTEHSADPNAVSSDDDTRKAEVRQDHEHCGQRKTQQDGGGRRPVRERVAHDQEEKHIRSCHDASRKGTEGTVDRKRDRTLCCGKPRMVENLLDAVRVVHLEGHPNAVATGQQHRPVCRHAVAAEDLGEQDRFRLSFGIEDSKRTGNENNRRSPLAPNGGPVRRKDRHARDDEAQDSEDRGFGTNEQAAEEHERTCRPERSGDAAALRSHFARGRCKLGSLHDCRGYPTSRCGDGPAAREIFL